MCERGLKCPDIGSCFVDEVPDLVRFWSKVSKTPSCWLWTSPLTKKGYGQFTVGSKNFSAHKWSYETFIGPVPGDLTLDHLCRVKHCVNPAHMEPVTREENSRRGHLFREWPVLIACPKGHPYDEVNLYIDPKGYPKCRTCRREGMRKK